MNRRPGQRSRTARALVVALAFALAPGARPAPAASLTELPAAPRSNRFTWAPITVPSGPVTDSEFALFHLQRALYDPVDPRLLGSLGEDLHFRVNGEVYRFGSSRTLERFRDEPELWCGLLRDPVSGLRFLPSTRSPRLYFVGGPYYFASDSTHDAFLTDPGRYEVKRAL